MSKISGVKIKFIGSDGKYRDKYGNVLCSHGARRYTCKNCCGASICQHGKVHHRCKECGGVSICEHGRIRNKCRGCRGSQICEHDRQRSQCSRCKPDTTYRKYQRDAAFRKIPFELSLEEFKQVVSGSCNYCGEILAPMTCDRINSHEGYSFSNCQPLCHTCNRMKLDHSEEGFYSHIISIFRHRSLVERLYGDK